LTVLKGLDKQWLLRKRELALPNACNPEHDFRLWPKLPKPEENAADSLDRVLIDRASRGGFEKLAANLTRTAT